MSCSPLIYRIATVTIGILFSCQVALALITITATIDPPTGTGNFLPPGSKLELACAASSGKPVQWKYLDQLPVPAKEVNANEVKGVTVTSNSGLFISSVSGDVGGKYSCTDGTEVLDYWVQVLDSSSLIPRNIAAEYTAEKETLKCDQRFKDLFPLIWLRKINATSEDMIILNNIAPEDTTWKVGPAEKGYELTIRNKDRKRYPLRTGEYICRINTTSLPVDNERVKGPIETTALYESKPDVRIEGVSQARTKSATKDESSTLVCVQNHDSKSSYLSWMFNNGTHEQVLADQPFDELPVCESDPSKRCLGGWTFSRKMDLENTTADQYTKTLILEFLPIVLESHRGNYTCALKDTIMADDNTERKVVINEARVDLKVKDKLAALWPFLGIVAEVVILCAIIFIYEKRRNKTVDEEDENEPMKGDNHETREAAVRSRK